MTPLLQPCKELRERSVKASRDDLERFEGDVLLTALNGAHDVPVKAHRVGETLLRISHLRPHLPHARSELPLQFVHAPSVAIV